MSWLRIFEAYRDLEAEKIASDARAEFLQTQVEGLQAQVEMLDSRAQAAQEKLLADRERVADMFSVRVMDEGVFDPSRQRPQRDAGPAPAAPPARMPGHLVARDLTKKAWQADSARIKAEAAELQRLVEERMGIKLSPPDRPEEEPHAQASTGGCAAPGAA